MGVKYAAPEMLDGGLLYLKNNAAKVVMLKAYAAGDSAAIIATNKLAEVAVAAADYTIASSGNDRVITCAAKSTNASTASVATPDLHVAHLDATGKAIVVFDETTDQAITAGNPFDLPAHSYTSKAPT